MAFVTFLVGQGTAKFLCKTGTDLLEQFAIFHDETKNIRNKLRRIENCFNVSVYDAFEQWKHLIHLLCSCVDAVDKHPDVFEAFIGWDISSYLAFLL